MKNNKLPIAERGYNFVLTLFLRLFGILFLALSVFLFVECVRCFINEDTIVGRMLLIFGIIVFIFSVVLLFFGFVNTKKKGRLQRMDDILGKFIE